MSTSIPHLESREILIGVTGGIAAYKSADLVSKLVQHGACVSVVMTRTAAQFVGAMTFEALTNRPVHGTAEVPGHYQGEHISLGMRAELYVIAPATANCLAKLATGLADDLVSTLCLTIECPLIVAPAMNCQMWEKPAVRRNVDRIRQDGVQIVEPGEGWLSCGQVGRGRMAEPAEIFAAISDCLKSSPRRPPPAPVEAENE